MGKLFFNLLRPAGVAIGCDTDGMKLFTAEANINIEKPAL